MTVGICKIRLRLAENQDLKGKRQVVKSITTRVKNKFNVSIAEVEELDKWQVTTLGISCVSNSHAHANEVLSKVVHFIEAARIEAEVLDYELELVHAL